MALETYRKKRNFTSTSEPAGEDGTPARGHSFVIQKHAARRLHYDFRLEMEGVLKSWAVAKGPSLAPGEKRLAVHVEDHPLEYGDYEGVIPEGNYGAGPSIIWDRGSWLAVESPEQSLPKGKLVFELKGYKLRGIFKLIRTKGGPTPGRDWLLVKKVDAFSRPGPSVFPEESV